MRSETMITFLTCLREFRGIEIGAIELTKLSGMHERFCRTLFADSGASRMRIGQAFFYRVSEIIAYLERCLANEDEARRCISKQKCQTLPGPAVESARKKAVQFCKDLKERRVETFTCSQLGGATGLSRNGLAKMLLVVSREKRATTTFYSVSSFLGIYARSEEISPDVCKVCGSLPETVQLMSVSGLRCSNLACSQHMRAFLTNDWVRYGSKKVS